MLGLHTDIATATTETPPPTTTPLLPALETVSSTLSSSFTLTSVSELKSRYTGSESPSEDSQLPGLFDVESESKDRRISSNELPLHPLHSLELQQLPRQQQQTPEAQEGLLLLKPEGAAVTGEEEGRGEESATTATDAAKESSDSSQVSDGDANLTEVQRTQKSLDGIFSALQLENPHAPAKETQEFNREGYAEFERLLTDPEGQKRILTSTEKSQFESDRSEFVAPPPTNQHARINETGSEIVNAAGNPSGYLEFLRQKTPSEGADEKKPNRDSEGGSPWPDIGGPDLQTVATKGTPPESEPRTVSDILPGLSEEAIPPLVVAVGPSATRERDLTTGEAITGPILREPRLEFLELEVEESGADGRKTAEEGAAAASETSHFDVTVSTAQEGEETGPPLSSASQEPPAMELSSLAAETGSMESTGRVEALVPPALEEVVGGAGGGVEGATGMAEQDIKTAGKKLPELFLHAASQESI